MAKKEVTAQRSEQAHNMEIAERDAVVLERGEQVQQLTLERNEALIRLDRADTRFRNLNSSLGKSSEMDTVETCVEAAKELADHKRSLNLLNSFLRGKDLLVADDPIKSAIQVIETFLEEVGSKVGEDEEA